MTAAECLVYRSWDDTILFLVREASDRKLRLFAAGCCRNVWHLLPERLRRAVEAAEQQADGLLSEQEWARTVQSVRDIVLNPDSLYLNYTSEEFASLAVAALVDDDLKMAAWGAAKESRMALRRLRKRVAD
jgi:hypothetical protein